MKLQVLLGCWRHVKSDVSARACHLLTQGYRIAFNNPSLCGSVTVIFSGKCLHLSKAILSINSKYFRASFTNGINGIRVCHIVLLVSTVHISRPKICHQATLSYLSCLSIKSPSPIQPLILATTTIQQHFRPCSSACIRTRPLPYMASLTLTLTRCPPAISSVSRS